MILASGSAPAKTILFGEHAVVYGKPAIAIPLSDIRANVQITRGSSQSHSVHIEAADIGVSASLQELAVDHPIRSAFRLFYDAINHPHPGNINLRIQSDIPVASGLGSGAAVAIAIFRALAVFEQVSLTTEQLSELAFEIEKIHHGTPSGIDNTVIAYEEPVWYIKNELCKPFSIDHNFPLLIANSGIAAPTSITVADVRALYQQKPAEIQSIMEHISDVTHQAASALDTGNLLELGNLMTQNHILLQDLTVSSNRLDEMVTAALDAGALGAKLTGGGRGGNIIILTDLNSQPKIRTALEAIGVTQFFSTILGKNIPV